MNTDVLVIEETVRKLKSELDENVRVLSQQIDALWKEVRRVGGRSGHKQLTQEAQILGEYYAARDKKVILEALTAFDPDKSSDPVRLKEIIGWYRDS